MSPDVLKAINDVNKRLNEVERKVENFLLEKHETNAEAIAIAEEAMMELAGAISEISEMSLGLSADEEG